MTAWLEYCSLWRLAFKTEWPFTAFAARLCILIVHGVCLTALGLLYVCARLAAAP